MYREKELNEISKGILKEFVKQWYPASDTPRIEDFLIWIQNEKGVVKEWQKNS